MEPVMIELNDKELMILRGQYSTIRSLHEDAKKALSILCGHLTSHATHILRQMQPDHDAIPGSIEKEITAARNVLARIEECAQQIEALARQRAELKPLAWPK
jgi:hypothetical protein